MDVKLAVLEIEDLGFPHEELGIDFAPVSQRELVVRLEWPEERSLPGLVPQQAQQSI